MRHDQEFKFAKALDAHRASGQFKPHEHVHEYFQSSLVSALLDGVYDGDMTVGMLLEHGNLGLGTFNALDGEMIVIDRVAYRCSVDGTVTRAADNELLPYAAVIEFEPDTSFELAGPSAKAEFEKCLDARTGSPNLFYALRVTGRFSHIKFRSVRRQDRPYKPLAELTDFQVAFERDDVTGTMVGFRSPDYAAGIGIPGYHLHFLSDDRQSGGHVLNYALASGRVEIDHTSEMHLEMPESGDFSAAKISTDIDLAFVDQLENDRR